MSNTALDQQPKGRYLPLMASKTFHVTTAQTVYETYTVEAESVEQAVALVANSKTRAVLDSFPAGDNEDEAVIDARQVSDI